MVIYNTPMNGLCKLGNVDGHGGLTKIHLKTLIYVLCQSCVLMNSQWTMNLFKWLFCLIYLLDAQVICMIITYIFVSCSDKYFLEFSLSGAGQSISFILGVLFYKYFHSLSMYWCGCFGIWILTYISYIRKWKTARIEFKLQVLLYTFLVCANWICSWIAANLRSCVWC